MHVGTLNTISSSVSNFEEKMGPARPVIIDLTLIETNRLNEAKILEPKKNIFIFGLINSIIIPESRRIKLVD